MGYTTYYGFSKFTDEDRQGWNEALPIIKEILNKYKSIIAYEDDEPETEPEATENLIRFNGIKADGHETFIVSASNTSYFCKTARKPYDIVVSEVCLVLKNYCPNFSLSSDGFYGYVKDKELDGSWNEAIQNVKAYGIHYKEEIVETHGGRNGEPDPYCRFELFLQKEPV